jgi:hypothetical protein
MPFKSIASLQKIASLDAEVVAIAPLENDRICGVLTNDPVKLAVYPFASGTKKEKSIGLEDVTGLALINKSVAVIKTGGELWGVINIQHSPKIDQVGRDIRALAHFANGGMALAVGWDGNGAALAIDKNEVGGRTFVLRGDLRAVALDAVNTYTIVNGAGTAGGQLRIHPGQTPEPGAIARVDLPSDAKGFNRLAASPDLVVLTKAGADSVCIVRAPTGGVEPVMLAVPGTVADVAVLESSMVVVCRDGKVRLYNSEVLARVGTDIIDPTFELNLKLSGAPTVVTTSTRTGNKLWIGSKGGDLVRCDAVKGDMMNL